MHVTHTLPMSLPLSAMEWFGQIRIFDAPKKSSSLTIPPTDGFFTKTVMSVPFDPFLPWIFMGEEIIMSTRLWTSGYDIFSPSQAVVGHIYVRRHKPKFWESVSNRSPVPSPSWDSVCTSCRTFHALLIVATVDIRISIPQVHRAFSPGVHNPLQAMVLDRVKYQLGYPEAAKDMLSSKSLLTAVEQYTMGTERPLSQYLAIVGLDVTTKEVTSTYWCESGRPPPGFEQFEGLYPK